MQEGARQNDAAPMYLERSLHYRREGKIDANIERANYYFIYIIYFVLY